MKSYSLMVGLAVAVAAAPLTAQGAGGGGWAQRDQTRQEAQQRADRLFQMLDANHDGTVTRAEAEQAVAQFEAARGSEASGRGVGRMQRLISQSFANGDSVTLAQFEALSLARFDAQDLNHDGVVTAAEREQARAQRSQGAVPPVAPAQPPRQ